MLYRSTLNAHKYKPVVTDDYAYLNNERQWLLVNSGAKRCAFLHIYIACQSSRNNNSFLTWNEDLFSLITQEALELKRQGFVILAMGDFNTRVGRIKGLEGNTPDINKNSPMFFRFIREVNLVIINTMPLSQGLFTRFNDYGSSGGPCSILDYGLIDAANNEMVSSFIIDDKARIACQSDHALLICDIAFSPSPKVQWSVNQSVQYNLRTNTDYGPYSDKLDSLLTSIPLPEFIKRNTDDMIAHITECINSAAILSIGTRQFKKKKGRKLPKDITSLIEKKNVLLTQTLTNKGLTQSEKQRELRRVNDMKADIKKKILNLRMKKRAKLRSKLLLDDPNRRKFWRLVRGQMTDTGKITAARNADGNMVFEQDEIEEVALEHFKNVFEGERVPIQSTQTDDETEACLAEIDRFLETPQRKFESDHFESEVCSPYTYTELENILQKLPVGKASGFDRYRISQII